MCNKWYGTEEVCQKLGYSKRHIYRLIKNGQIISYKPNGARIFFKKEDIENWIERGKTLNDVESSIISKTYLIHNS